MNQKRIGKQTLQFANPPVIASTAAIAGPLEAAGPLGKYYDLTVADSSFEEDTWEKAECKMLKEAAKLAMQKVQLLEEDIHFFLAGDLLNQIISANFAARDLQIPFLGLYGACSTMAESLGLGAAMIDGGFANRVVAAACSHFDTAERQYRFPTELGTQRRLTTQRTVTGAGSAVLASAGEGPVVTHVTFGKVIDLGIKDANNMGAAMAPAAADTIVQHLKDTGRSAQDYDLIITGDLAQIGKNLTQELVRKEGFDISSNFDDCGLLVFYEYQDTHAGGSGCGCSAIVFCSYLMHQLKQKVYNRILLVGTGALLSPTSTLQGESIPGIAHAVVIENRGKR